jgi:hypothetical protein
MKLEIKIKNGSGPLASGHQVGVSLLACLRGQKRTDAVRLGRSAGDPLILSKKREMVRHVALHDTTSVSRNKASSFYMFFV